ncbi:DeoR/GlpR transcriptional regulator [Pedobacter changchengzhani]|uniref:DeoR/GlpR transcriptional regulator n=1 Tax=Pedobacter changchengzhani TaxID=2529274 RepID=A0A4R5MIZ6_9SPHI|nr:DeoR/GlpR family DNA-binding transcription regulator [Pedobacter changchengzhani]TDG35029.1 DeoR/GlpR transcriptional regulator [Pedobacter changchengzhani]
MKSITDRHEFIITKLKENGKVNITELIDLMEVSGVTIRKDLKLLENKSLLFRTRGGGSIKNPYANERSFEEKVLINAREKQKIAKLGLTLINDCDSLSLGPGTTVFELTRILHPTKPLTVITPALKVSLELSNRPNIEVLQLGGMIKPNSSAVVGAHAESLLGEISCCMLFLGVDGIDLDFGFSITNIPEAMLNQRMIKSAQKVVILADSSKFDKRGLGKVCGFEQVDYIVTDDKVSADIVQQIEEKGVKVIIC